MDLADRIREAVADRYAVERELGRGGMAVVYLARDPRHERHVAIKVLRPELTVTLVADRFLREIQIAAQLQHPLIVPLYDSGGTDELLWYVMPFIEGETLRQRLERERQLPLEDALEIARDAAAALQCAHEHGFVHRDIKPENILLSGGHALLADFGIARALTRAAGEGTSSGVAIGTPAYMSPEQAAGGAVIDERSDIYSLGCVLYEMLAGEPPFTGPTPQAVIARHVSARTPSVRVVRPAVPEEVEEAIEHALAKAPADRFHSADELVQALLATPGENRRTRLAAGRKDVIAIGLASAAAAVLLYWLVPRVLPGGELNPSHYVLAPFLTVSDRSDRERYKLWEQELMSALRQVPDITVVEATLVNDRRLRRPGDVSDFGYWLRVARDLHAGRLVVPSLAAAGDSGQLVAEVYDVRRGRALRRAGVILSAGGEASEAAARLAERLFALPDGVLRVSRSGVEGAQRAFVAGKAALESWDLRGAETRFQEAATLDPDYGHAQFWLAQTKAWAGDPPGQWIGAARRAARAGAQLADARERALAAALLAMAERQFPQACARYDSLVAGDSLSFEAWFGLGECHAKDDLVLPDRGSRSGFRFRTGYHTAVRAYERALEVAPSFAFQFQPLRRLPDVLMVEPSRLRFGRGSQDTTVTWAAFASLDHDTLAFVPWPLDSIRSGSPVVLPAQLNEAVARNRQRLLRIVTSWVRVFPDSSDAAQTLALALELTGALDGTDDVERSALAAARRARSTARERMDSVRSVVAEVRVLVKLGRFDDAQRLGVTAIRLWDAEPQAADELDGIAALLGRPHLAARLAAQAAAPPPTRAVFPTAFPANISQARRALDGYAALGAPADSIAALADRLDRLLEVGVPPAVARQFRCSEESVSLGRAFPQLRRGTQDPRCRMGTPMLEMQWALLNRDTAAVRAAFARGRAMRRTALPGEIALDHVFHEAWVLLQVGDTAIAAEYLDRTLAALSALRTSVTREPQQAGALVRAMALRAELAAAAGDRATARRWAEPVTILWRDADPELRPIIERMRRIAESR